MTVAVVVDSAASLPRELVERHRIGLVPMSLTIDGTTILDDAISTEQLVAQLPAREVTTSGPSPGEFTTSIERALDWADDVLVLTLSQEMSSTFATAELAARLMSARVRVIDTRTAAGGEGLVALAAARRASQGASIDEVVAHARDVIGSVHLVATLDSLAQLARSGRVPEVARLAASTLHMRPLFEFSEGKAHPLGTRFSERSARRQIVQRCLASRPASADAHLHVAALDALATDRARALLDDVLAEVPGASWFIGSFGPVMLVHVGAGVSGLAWWWEG